jgi:hypothetical protein
MSTITLDMLTTMIADARPELSASEQGVLLADTLVTLDRAYAEEARKALVAATPVQTTPAPKAPKAYVMPTVASRKARYASKFFAGPASAGQKKRIVKYAADHGYEAFTSADLRDMSAVCAAEWLVFMHCDNAGVTYVEATR